jgi:hypothetical protein
MGPKVMGISDHFRYSGVAGETTMTSRAMSFYFLLDSGVGSTINVVDLLVRLREVALWIFGLLFLVGLFGQLENLIYKAL